MSVLRDTLYKLNLEKNPLYRYVDFARFLFSTQISRIKGTERIYPRVIQLPITYFCNARCIMCDVWNMDHSNELNANELRELLADPIFKRVKSVGINGGEPSLIRNLDEYARAIIDQLPSLRSLNIISHGFHTTRLLGLLKSIYRICKKRGILFHVSISLDGYESIHDTARGIPKVFGKTFRTIKEIQQDGRLYCDTFDVGCTVMAQNVDYLVQLEAFARKHNFPIKYRMAIENRRIDSDKYFPLYNAFDGTKQLSSKNFFFSQYLNSKSLVDKFKYFSIFNSINNRRTKRLLGCAWKDEGITLDSRGSIYYCAVESKSLGNLKEAQGEALFFSQDHLNYRKSIVDNKCDHCVHDYQGRAELRNILVFLHQVLRDRLWTNVYAFKLRFIP